MTDEYACDSAEFVNKLAELTKNTAMRCAAMLGWLGDVKKTKEDALRIAYAIMGYLPCFDSEDTRLEEKYIGDPVFPVHGRFIAARAYYKTEKNPVVDVAFLAMSTILAGRVYIMQLSLQQADIILKKIYKGRGNSVNAYHVELSGCYITIPSDWLAMRMGKISELSCTSEMRNINKTLCKRRASRTCSVSQSCATCSKGRDQCSIAVRRITKGGNNGEQCRSDNAEGPDKR